jgi:hypothetical protein
MHSVGTSKIKNMKYIIKIHSFVDLITNSSTEIYIAADESTITTIKELINNILKLGGSKLTCDELFEFSLGDEKDTWANREYGYKDISMIVIPKDSASPEGVMAATVLGNLTGLFNINAVNNS